MNYGVLLLNASYEPMIIIDWRDAIRFIYLKKASILETYENPIKTANGHHPRPSVVILEQYAKRKSKGLKFSRDSIFQRDNYRCQYCLEKFTKSQLTYDHVIPKAQGGKKSWSNIVASCKFCNGKKANKTPEQAKMSLTKKPTKPDFTQKSMIISDERMHPTWEKYL